MEGKVPYEIGGYTLAVAACAGKHRAEIDGMAWRHFMRTATRKQLVDALGDPRTGTYLDEARGQYVCLAWMAPQSVEGVSDGE